MYIQGGAPTYDRYIYKWPKINWELGCYFTPEKVELFHPYNRFSGAHLVFTYAFPFEAEFPRNSEASHLDQQKSPKIDIRRVKKVPG